MADQALDALDSDEIPHPFLCCVCLELLHKPVVLSCGHISCFWCVHKSMNAFQESLCPICRHRYYHFPTICEMLQHLILKIFPVAYKKREDQILEEEKKTGFFSPQFDVIACGPQASKKVKWLGDSAKGELNLNSNVVVKYAPIADLTSHQDIQGPKTQNHEQVSVSDVQCPACNQLLFRPMVLNCGHVFCESCISDPDVQIPKCQICQCLNPRGFPNVCLELDQFLREQFPEEYSLRKDSVQLKLANLFKHESPTSCSNKGDKTREDIPKWSEVASKVHYGVGCDSCGMYPIIGDRYRCLNCPEKIGFDLCGECYNTSSKRPGRFNQQHTPEHKFELMRLDHVSSMRIGLVTRILDDGSRTFFIADHGGSESSDDDLGVALISNEQESNANGVTSEGQVEE